MKSLQELRFSYNRTSVQDKTSKNETITLSDLISRIKDGNKPSYYDTIAQTTIKGLNEDLDFKKVISSLKLKLPYYLFSGTQEIAHSDEYIEYNGCLQIDIDFKEKGGDVKALKTKELLKDLPYIIFAGISPSGVGVKALVQTDNLNKEYHKDIVIAVYDMIARDIDIEFKLGNLDKLPVSQPCYTFYDKDLYVTDLEYYSPIECGELIKKLGGTITSKGKSSYSSNKPLSEVEYKDFQLSKTAIKSTLDKLYTDGIKTEGRISTRFFTVFIRGGNSKGVRMQEMIDYCIAKGLKQFIYESNGKLTADGRRFGDMCKLYTSEFATNVSQVEKIPTNGEVVKYKLDSVTPKVSDLNLDFDMLPTSNIISPTGSGKTYAVLNSQSTNIILCVPTANLVQQSANDYGVTPFFEDLKDLSDKSKIVTTYKSLPNLISKLGNVSDYMLFIDEAHNFASSTSADYLLDTMTDVKNSIKLFKKAFYLTATPISYIQDELFQNLPTILIEKDVTVNKTFYDVKIKDRVEFLTIACVANKSENIQSAILLQNKNEDGKLGEVVFALEDKGLKVGILNSSTKDTEEYKTIAIGGDMSEFDVIITTTVIKEGQNILKHNEDIYIYVCGYFHPIELEQYSARFRNAKNISLFLFKSPNHKESTYKFSLTQEIESINIIANDQLESYKKHNSINSYYSSKFLKTLSQQYVRFVENDEYVLEAKLDTLNITNEIFESEKFACNTQNILMSAMLSDFGWEYNNLFDGNILNIEASVEDTSKRKESKKVRTNEKNIKVKNIIEKVKNETPFENNIKLESKLIKDKLELEIRYKLAVLSNLTQESDSHIEATRRLLGIGLTNSNWSDFMDALVIRKIRTDKRFKNVNCIELDYINRIYDDFKVGESYTSEEIQSKFMNARAELFGTKESYITKIQATTMFKQYFNITFQDVTFEGVRIKSYKIVGDCPTNLVYKEDLNKNIFLNCGRVAKTSISSSNIKYINETIKGKSKVFSNIVEEVLLGLF